jgi:crossover junction endodeoxyribonuclease RuvC
MSVPERLSLIEKGILSVTEKYSPDAAAVEELFFTKNITTGITVAEARGVILLTLLKSCKQLYEYTPNEIKKAVTGYGSADKFQVQQMTTALLRLAEIPKPDDAADALAIALCHAQTGRLSGAFKM